MSGKRFLGLVLALFCLLLAACGGTANQGGSPTATPQPAAPTATTGTGQYQVGQTAKVGVWDATLNSVTTNPGDGQVNVPQNGVFLILDLTFKNNDTGDHDVNVGIQMTLKDSTGQLYQDAFVTLPGVTSPDSDVQGGDLVRGQVVYDVPTNQHQFTFTYAAVISPGAATWDISV